MQGPVCFKTILTKFEKADAGPSGFRFGASILCMADLTFGFAVFAFQEVHQPA